MWDKVKDLLVAIFILLLSEITTGLEDVRIQVPKMVKTGEMAVLICEYELGNDTLYGLKWYKGNREFYRYTPKEIPAQKIFPIYGISVKTNLSNETHLTIQDLKLVASGRYTCEVSADYPSFQTLLQSKELIVVDPLPDRPVQIEHEYIEYGTWAKLQANCTKSSSPAAKLEFLINNHMVDQNYVTEYREIIELNPKIEQVTIHLNIDLTQKDYVDGGVLTLRCIARIFDFYKQDAFVLLRDSVNPRVLTSSSKEQSGSLSFKFDEHEDYSKGLSITTTVTSVQQRIITAVTTLFGLLLINWRFS